MKIPRRKKRAFYESNASSDIAFLLIIYFIVITGFNINKGFLLDLPAKDSTKVVMKDDILRVALNETGAIVIFEKETNKEEAESIIKAAVARNPNIAVILSVSPLAPWQGVVSFVETAQRLNVDSFSFAMVAVNRQDS